MIFSSQRLRNLTTHRLHTKIEHVYQDLNAIIGEDDVVMTHMIPNILDSIEPWLKEHVTNPRYWNGEYDPTHLEELELPDPSEKDKKTFLKRYMSKPNPLAGKEVLTVLI